MMAAAGLRGAEGGRSAPLCSPTLASYRLISSRLSSAQRWYFGRQEQACEAHHLSLSLSLSLSSTGGAAVKAGVHEGDRIIKVCPPRSTLNTLVLLLRTRPSSSPPPSPFGLLRSLSLLLLLSPRAGQWLARLVYVSPGGGEAHQM